MTAKRIVEVFGAVCPACDEAIALVRALRAEPGVDRAALVRVVEAAGYRASITGV